jgi:hypothetical protein
MNGKIKEINLEKSNNPSRENDNNGSREIQEQLLGDSENLGANSK